MFDTDEWAPPLSIAELLKMVRRWWWMCVPPIGIAIGLAVLFTTQAAPVYQAEAEVVIRTEESANLFPLSDAAMLTRSPSAEAGFLESTEFELAAIDAADSDAEVSVDVGDVNSRVEPSFISFQARAGSAEEAARVAQAWAQTYIELRHERDAGEVTQTISILESRLAVLDAERQVHLEVVNSIDEALQRSTDTTQISQLTTQRLVLLQALAPSLEPLDAQVEIISDELAELLLVADFFDGAELSARINRTADVPDAPVSPSLPRNIVLALIAGSLLGFGAIVLAEALDDRARSVEMVSRRLGVDGLSSVPYRRKDDESIATTTGPIAESFHRLASAIDFSELAGTSSKVLMFTSANASEAKTTTVTRLGATLARQGRRTLVIGADLRRPLLSNRLDLGSGAGLGEVLGGLYSFSSCVTEVPGHDGLFMLRSGTVATESSPVDLLRTDALEALIEEIRPEFDHILIDCPPVLPVVDALEIARVCDGVVLNVFAGKSRLARVERALEMIMQATRSPVIGFVLTGTRAMEDSYRGDYYTALKPMLTANSSGRRGKELSVATSSKSRNVSSRAEQHAPPTEIIIQDPLLNEEVSGARASAASESTTCATPIDDVTFTVDGHESEAADLVATSNGKERKRMKSLRNMLSVIVAVGVLLTTAPLGAQSYEGTSIDEGIFFIPAAVGGGSDIDFSVAGLEPGSEIGFKLFDSSGGDVDGLEVEVLGRIVVQADANGNFNGDIGLPPNLAPGIYTVEVDGTRAGGSDFATEVSFTVAGAAAAQAGDDTTTASTGTGDGELAFTGASSSRTALNGALIVGAGLLLVFVASRRREEPLAASDV